MKIEFRKIGFEPKHFDLRLTGDDFDLQISGSLFRRSDGLIRLDSALKGKITLICDKSGDEFSKNISEKLSIFIKNGVYKEAREDSENLAVVEVFDNFVDLEAIFLGEIEAMRLDYHTKDDLAQNLD